MSIDTEIEALERKLEKLKKTKNNPWPRKVVVSLNESKETMYDLGKEFGLRGEALQTFQYFGVDVEISLNQDGTYEILGAK